MEFAEPVEPDPQAAALTLAVRLGEVLLANGVPTGDVEHAVEETAASLGVTNCQASVLLRTMVVSVLPADGSPPVTIMRKVRRGTPDLHRLALAHRLVRDVEEGGITPGTAALRLTEILISPPPYPKLLATLATALAVAGFAVSLGAGPVGALVGAVAAVFVAPLSARIAAAQVPPAFATVAAAFGVTIVPVLVARAGITFEAVPAVVGAIYLLLPGAALVAAVLDGLSDSPLSALAQALSAFVTASAIAVGVLLALRVGILLGPGAGISPQQWSPLVTSAAVAVAMLAAGVARRVPPGSLAPMVALATAADAAVFVVSGQGVAREIATFLAALAVGLGGQVLARIQRSSALVFTSVAVLPLVPGYTLYQAMGAYAQGDTTAGAEYVRLALVLALMIAAGVPLGLAAGRQLLSPRWRSWVREEPK